MSLTPTGFVQRLESGKSVNCIYQAAGVTGLISIWKHEAVFVLTWEECRPGTQHDEHDYTRDEVHHFAAARDALAFVEQHGLPASSFGP